VGDIELPGPDGSVFVVTCEDGTAIARALVLPVIADEASGLRVDSSNGVITADDGSCALSLPPSTREVLVAKPGYATERIPAPTDARTEVRLSAVAALEIAVDAPEPFLPRLRLVIESTTSLQSPREAIVGHASSWHYPAQYGYEEGVHRIELPVAAFRRRQYVNDIPPGVSFEVVVHDPRSFEYHRELIAPLAPGELRAVDISLAIDSPDPRDPPR
jgi:hypothetical protein